jgi:hypothetical protein
MSVTHLPAGMPAPRSVEAPTSHDAAASHEQHASQPSDELADLYGALLITLPLAFFLRWLWP